MWNCHIDDSVKCRYYIIIGIYLLTYLGLNLKFENVFKRGYRPLKRSTAPMIDLGTYKFKYLNMGKIIPKKNFMNAYVEEVFES